MTTQLTHPARTHTPSALSALAFPRCVVWVAAYRQPTVADGTAVPTIVNLADPANPLTQASGTKQATQESDAASRLGGKPILRFDGTDDWYALTTPIVVNDYTSIYVGKNTGSNQAFWGGDATTGIGMVHAAFGTFYNYAGTFDDISAYTSSAMEIVVIRRRAGVHQIWVNGTEKTSGATDNATAATIKYLWKDVDGTPSDRVTAAGDLAEAALCQAALSDPQWRSYVAALGNQYQIPVAF